MFELARPQGYHCVLMLPACRVVFALILYAIPSVLGIKKKKCYLYFNDPLTSNGSNTQ